MDAKFDVDEEPCECCGSPDLAEAIARRKLMRMLAWAPYLAVVEVEGVRWFTDTHWLVRADRPDVVELFAWWNLAPTVGRYSADRDRLSPDEGKNVDPALVAAIVARIPSPVSCTPRLFGETTCPVLVRAFTARTNNAMLRRPDNTTALLAVDYFDWAAPAWNEGGWTFLQRADHDAEKDRTANTTAVQCFEDDELRSVIMPVRLP